MVGIGGEAELEAENSRYYNLKGYLATVTVLQKIITLKIELESR